MIEEILSDVSEALLIPVLVLTVAALALVIVEAGALLVATTAPATPSTASSTSSTSA